MTSGIQVLYQYNRFSDIKIFLSILMTLYSVVALSTIIVDFQCHRDDLDARFIPIVLMILACIIGWTGVSKLPNNTYVCAIISEETTVNELYSQYEVDSVRGKIYTLKVIEELETK